MMITNQQIQQKITEAIRQSGLTQVKLAGMLKITQSSIAHYIKGDITPSLETFANLCRILDLDANEILCIK